MLTTTDPQAGVYLALTGAINRSETVEEIHAAALDALEAGLQVSRASVLLFDPDGVMRFKASRGLSEDYRRAVEGHTPWTADTRDAQPIVVSDVKTDAGLAPFLHTITAEGIAAMAFIPLISLGKVIGKFMLYHPAPRDLTPAEVQLAGLIASQVAFAVERTRSSERARRSEERLRFALDAASMGTWDWDLATQTVRWSDNLERLHGLPPGTFDGSFASYEGEIHEEDRPRVIAAARRAIDDGVPYEVEYRIVAPDGTVRWVEGKGRVEYDQHRPVRLTGVCMIVTRRKEAELARLAAAEESSRLKDEFLATLSHELRTPLNAILGWAQMLQGGALPPERSRQAIDVIARNAKLQAQLIEDILEVSRIIAGKLDIERVPLLVSKVVETAIAAALPAAQAKNIEIVMQAPSGLPPIEGDGKRLQQVLGNVISNAIKFTPMGGRVDVVCGTQGDSIAIDVRDCGVGIAPAFLPFIFDRFRQADSRTTRRHGGLGLGLAIARHLIERHHGEIRAHSEGLGRGTTVHIRLPVSSSIARDAVASIPSGVVDSADSRSLRGATVIVVDDQDDSRELLAALFEQWEARVVQATSASATIDSLDRLKIDLLVADIAMPDVDGYALIRQLRDAANHVPAIAVSAYARPEDRNRAYAAGYNGYCTKPVDAAEFLRVVRSVLLGAAWEQCQSQPTPQDG